MRRSTTTRALAVVVALVAGLVGVTMAVPPATTAEVPAVAVTFPELTMFNPDVAEYAVDIADTASYRAFAVVEYGSGQPATWAELVGSGPHAIDFTMTDVRESARVRIIFCDGDPFVEGTWPFQPGNTTVECPTSAIGPVLVLWTAVHMNPPNEHYRQTLGPNKPFNFQYDPWSWGGEIAWRVLDGDREIASGSQPNTGSSQLFLGDQPGFAQHALYDLELTLRTDDPNFGPMSGTAVYPISWDSEVIGDAELGVLKSSDDWLATNEVYPVEDGYRDTIFIWARSLDVGTIRGVVRDPEGNVFDLGSETAGPMGAFLSFGGFDPSLPPPIEGTYAADVTLIDRALNEKSVQLEFEVHAERTVQRLWKRTISAEQAAVRGRLSRYCGWFKKPARSTWTGSIGYRTRDDCRGSIAGRMNRIVMPESVNDRYGAVRVTATGGRAIGVDSSRLNIAVSRIGHAGATAYTSRFVADGRYGKHPGPWMEEMVSDPAYEVFQPWEIQEWALYWYASARNGDDYDVRSFTVEVEYDVLE